MGASVKLPSVSSRPDQFYPNKKSKTLNSYMNLKKKIS